MTRPLPPGFIEPCIPAKAAKAPAGRLWIHELKHDGFRLMVRRVGSDVRLLTKTGFDWTGRFGWIVDSARYPGANSFLIDGVAVPCRDDGVPNFDQADSVGRDASVCLQAFDLLELDGSDLRKKPLLERKAALQRLLAKGPPGIRFVEHIEADGSAVFEQICKLGLAGLVSKRRDMPYRSGRSRSWVVVSNPKAASALRP
jgi:bifunctional non-homologous end joining protein LigD